MADIGYIYILRNPSHEENVFKVGMTTRNVEERVNELNRETSNPRKFETVAFFPVRDTKAAEMKCHQALKQFQYGKEFFRCEVPFLIETVEKISSAFSMESFISVDYNFSKDFKLGASKLSLSAIEIESENLYESDDLTFYERAYLELENRQPNVGTWAKVLAAANGDEKQAKILYLKVRTEAFKQEEVLNEQIKEAKLLEAKRLEESIRTEEEKNLQPFRDKAQKFFTPIDTSDFQNPESEVASLAPESNAKINFSDETQRQFKAKAFQIYYASFPKELLAVPSNFNPYFSNFSDKYRNKIPIDSSINSIDFHLLFLGFFSGILDLSRLDDWIKSNDDRVNFIAHALDGKHETGYWENINFPSYCRWLDRQLLKKPHHPDIVLRRLYALDWLLGNKNQGN